MNLCVRAIAAIVAVVCLGPPAASMSTSPMPRAGRDRGAEAATGSRPSLDELPMAFEPNVGQTDARVKFLARGRGYGVFATSDEIVLALAASRPESPRREDGREEKTRASHADVLRMRVDGVASGATIAGERPLAGTSNYIRGGDPGSHIAGIETYEAVRYSGVYEGIDLVLHGSQRDLEYDFVVAPGADPGRIRLKFSGQDAVETAEDGSVILRMAGGEVRQQRAEVYQALSTGRRNVAARYEVGADGLVTLSLGEYDRALPLVVDPVLSYLFIYAGGRSDDTVRDIAVDALGNVYAVGETTSFEFPTTAGAYDTTAQVAPPYEPDAFVTKLDPTGSTLVFSTYLGGRSEDVALGVAVGPSGNVFVVGHTTSANFPVSPGALDTTYGNGPEDGFDGFAAELSANGSSLVYATYLGGIREEEARGVAVDGAGVAYVAGWTASPEYPTTPGAFDRVLDPGGASDCFVAKIHPGGGSLDYSTFLGNFGGEFAYDIALDASKNVYVTGVAFDAAFPTTPGAVDTTFQGTEAFVTKINPTGSAIVYSTFLGGSFLDEASSIAVFNGTAYVTGFTTSTNFPTTAGAFDPIYNGFEDPEDRQDVFAARVSADGASLIYGTYLGGTSYEYAYGIAVDGTGATYLTGVTASAGFPTTAGAFDTVYSGGSDIFVARLNPAGTMLGYSTLVSGESFGGEGLAIAADSAGRAYVGGDTISPTFPTTPGVFDAEYNGGLDAFVLRLNAAGSALDYSTFLDGNGDDTAYGVRMGSNGDIYFTGKTPASDFPGEPQPHSRGDDAFVTRIAADGSHTTFVGGAGDDVGTAVAIDSAGRAWIAGSTTSPDFPTTSGAADRTYGGLGDAFVTGISADGTQLVSSTYLGDSGLDTGEGVAVDAAGSVYVTGRTQSSAFPTTAGAFDRTFGGGDDGFVAKLSPTAALVYSTFVGGAGADQPFDLQVDALGAAYVAGGTASADFPTTPGAFDTTVNPGGTRDAFVTKLAPDGASLAFSTVLGGALDDTAYSVAVQADGTVVLCGATASPGFPTTPGAFDTTLGGPSDAFVTKIAPTGSSLVFSTYLGGDSDDVGFAVDVDSDGAPYVVGRTRSANFPVVGVDNVAYRGRDDGFVTILLPGGEAPSYSTYFGGAGDDTVYGIDVDVSRRVVFVGETALAFVADAGGTTGASAFVATINPLETVGVYVPSTGTWFLRYSSTPGSADVAFSFGPGGAGLVPIVGDWNNDGVDTPGLYDPATGAFFLRNSNSPGDADVVFTFGVGGLVPIAGDWEADGRDSVGLYDPATGAFFLKNSNTPGPADVVFTFGAGGAGFVPLAGDWNDDRVDTVGLYSPATGAFYLKNANQPGVADRTFSYGPAGVIPLHGDWNGSGGETIGVYVPSTSAWFLRNSNSPGPGDIVFTYGPSGVVPLAGNWDGR